MFYVYRENYAQNLIRNPFTDDPLFFDADTLKKAVEKDAEEEMFEDGDSVRYVLIDLKNKTFKTLIIYYVLTYTTEIEVTN